MVVIDENHEPGDSKMKQRTSDRCDARAEDRQNALSDFTDRDQQREPITPRKRVGDASLLHQLKSIALIPLR